MTFEVLDRYQTSNEHDAPDTERGRRKASRLLSIHSQKPKVSPKSIPSSFFGLVLVHSDLGQQYFACAMFVFQNPRMADAWAIGRIGLALVCQHLAHPDCLSLC